MSPDPTPDLRASDADREATVTRLQTAAHEGRLDAEELEERIAAAYGARHLRELRSLTVDVIPPPSVPPTAPAPVPVTARTNGLAVVSLVSGFLWLGWFGSVLAVVLGHIALAQIRASGGRESGHGVAIAGLVLGYGGLATFLLGFAWFFFEV